MTMRFLYLLDIASTMTYVDIANVVGIMDMCMEEDDDTIVRMYDEKRRSKDSCGTSVD